MCRNPPHWPPSPGRGVVNAGECAAVQHYADGARGYQNDRLRGRSDLGRGHASDQTVTGFGA
jgi:hypothetical protein